MEPLPDLHMPQAKRCNTCDTLKDRDEFGKDTYRPDGQHDRCKECRVGDSASFRSKNPERGRRNTARWRAANPGKQREYAMAHTAEKQAAQVKRREANPEKYTIYNATWYLKNKERLRPIRAKWEEENREDQKAKDAAYYLLHADEYRERERGYYAKDPGHFLAKHKQYIAQKHNAEENDFSEPQWQEIQAIQKHCCYYCGRRCKGTLTQDHIQPLSKGGSHTFRNVIAVCLSCNSRKGDRPAPVAVQIPLLVVAPPATPRGPRPRKKADTDPQQTLALRERD